MNNELERLRQAIEWFENSIVDGDPSHTDEVCPDCRNNRVALRVLREKLAECEKRGGGRRKDD